MGAAVMAEALLLGAHEMGHIAVSQRVEGIRADDDGWTVLCDAPQSQEEVLSQMIAGCLAEVILVRGVDRAMAEIRADKNTLCTDIGEHDWFFINQIPHQMCIDTASRIAPIISAELASMGKTSLTRLGNALLGLKPGQTLTLKLPDTGRCQSGMQAASR